MKREDLISAIRTALNSAQKDIAITECTLAVGQQNKYGYYPDVVSINADGSLTLSDDSTGDIWDIGLNDESLDETDLYNIYSHIA